MGHVVVQLMYIHVKILMYKSMYIRAEIPNNTMMNKSPFEFVFEEVCQISGILEIFVSPNLYKCIPWQSILKIIIVCKAWFQVITFNLFRRFRLQARVPFFLTGYCANTFQFKPT